MASLRLYALATDGIAATIATIEGFGRFTAFSLQTFSLILRQPGSWLRWRLIGPQLYAVGVASIPVVAITGAFIGMILALEGYYQFAAIGQENRMGGIINASVTRQIGPVLAAVMVAGRVGGALAAEIGSMRVTEQLDAMRAMAADPIRILVVPRVVACTAMTPLLTLYSDLLGSCARGSSPSRSTGSPRPTTGTTPRRTSSGGTLPTGS